MNEYFWSLLFPRLFSTFKLVEIIKPPFLTPPPNNWSRYTRRGSWELPQSCVGDTVYAQFSLHSRIIPSDSTSIFTYRLFGRLFTPLDRKKRGIVSGSTLEETLRYRVLSGLSPHFGHPSGPFLHCNNLRGTFFLSSHTLPFTINMATFLKKPLKLALVQLASGRLLLSRSLSTLERH